MTGGGGESPRAKGWMPATCSGPPSLSMIKALVAQMVEHMERSGKSHVRFVPSAQPLPTMKEQYEPMTHPITGWFIKMRRLTQDEIRQRWTGRRNETNRASFGKAKRKP